LYRFSTENLKGYRGRKSW